MKEDPVLTLEDYDNLIKIMNRVNDLRGNEAVHFAMLMQKVQGIHQRLAMAAAGVVPAGIEVEPVSDDEIEKIEHAANRAERRALARVEKNGAGS